MLEMSRNTHINRRISSHPLRKAFAVTACAAAGLMGLAAVPAAAAQAAASAPAVLPNQAPGSADASPRPGDTPAVSATGLRSGVLANLFYTGTDGHAYAVGLPPSGSAASFGGRLIGGPATTTGTLFGRGTDNALWQYEGSSHQAFDVWASLGGGLTSRPGAAAGALSVRGGQSLDLVVRGTDGAVWDREFNVATVTWRAWMSLGGRVLAGTGPAAVNVGGTLYVLAVGTDHALWVKHSTDGTHWSAWRSLGGRVIGDVGAATPVAGAGVAFVRGTNNAAWYNEFAGATEGVTPGWHTLGGTLTSGVGAGSAAGGMTWAVVLSTDNHVWQCTGTWPALHWSRVL
jgi:hypothetical protein